MLDAMGYDTGMALERLLQVARGMPAMVGHDVPGQVAKAGPSMTLHPAPAYVAELREKFSG
jgi:hydroxymethylglutaryl-CoA lyase